MDQKIRELQRLAHEGDLKAAERLERELGRIGRHALLYREQANKDADPIEIVEQEFDQTWWFSRINPGIVLKEFPGYCMLKPLAKWNWVPGKQYRPHNSKRKTLRTHRNGKARR